MYSINKNYRTEKLKKKKRRPRAELTSAGMRASEWLEAVPSVTPSPSRRPSARVGVTGARENALTREPLQMSRVLGISIHPAGPRSDDNGERAVFIFARLGRHPHLPGGADTTTTITPSGAHLLFRTRNAPAGPDRARQTVRERFVYISVPRPTSSLPRFP